MGSFLNFLMVPSTSADTANHVYTQVYVNGVGPYSVTFNNQPYTLNGPIVLDYRVCSVQVGDDDVLLLGSKRAI